MRTLLLLTLFLPLLGCEDNPYPGNGELSTEPAKPRVIVKAPFSADIPDNVDFKEGEKSVVSLRFSVPEPGKPLVDIENLPDGAIFDSNTNQLSWTPDFTAGNNAKDPSIKNKIYPVTVWLRSSADNINALKKTINFIVYDSPREFKIDGPVQETVEENNTMQSQFSIKSVDFPTGPFTVTGEDLPPGALIEQINDKDFKIKFTPDFFHVKAVGNNDCSYWQSPCKKYDIKLTAVNPANYKADFTIALRVNDQRLDPTISLPGDIEQGLNVNFQITSYDTNREIAPILTMLTSRPRQGQFTITESTDAANFSSVLNVKWSDIPIGMIGKSFPFSFKSCVHYRSNSKTNCKTELMKVKIVDKDRIPPIINRVNWPVGNIQYLNLNENKRITMAISDGEDRNITPKVEVFPESMRPFVNWSSGSIRLNFKTPGIKQFNIVATSEHKVQSAESFLVEVFEKNHSPFLLLADSTRDLEVQFFKRMYSNLKIMNPVLQDLNERTLSGRSTLILGTSVLGDISIHDKIQLAIDKVSNIIMASPLMDNLPDKFKNELQDEYDIHFAGRYLSFSNLPDLKNMDLLARGDFNSPIEKVTLKQTTSSQSLNPFLFSTLIDNPYCRSVIELSDANRNHKLQTGVICRRKNRSGRISLFGTEWADIKVGTADAKIPEHWYRRMLTAPINN